MNKVIYFSETAVKKLEEPKNIKEEKQMKKSIIKFSEITKKNVLRGGGAFLMVIAAFFASVACTGFFYEPKFLRSYRRKHNKPKIHLIFTFTFPQNLLITLSFSYLTSKSNGHYYLSIVTV